MIVPYFCYEHSSADTFCVFVCGNRYGSNGIFLNFHKNFAFQHELALLTRRHVIDYLIILVMVWVMKSFASYIIQYKRRLPNTNIRSYPLQWSVLIIPYFRRRAIYKSLTLLRILKNKSKKNLLIFPLETLWEDRWDHLLEWIW